MNLLVITNNPQRPSFRQRIKIYLDALSKNEVNCEIARFPSRFVIRRKFFRRCADFDAVYLHKKKLNCLDACWLRRYSRKVIYDFDDAVMYSDKDPCRKSYSRERLFRRTVKSANLVIAGNSYLADHARRYNQNVQILPTGINVDDYQVAADRENDGKIVLVWIGSKSTLKYLNQISEALEEIGQRYPQAVLRVICDEFPDLTHIPVEKKTWSLESQAVELATSDIGLSPLPDNRFTRGKCGFKILQYAAASLPTIASPVGVNRDYVQDGVTGYHAINHKQWVDKISRLIDNSQDMKSMGQNARREVEKNFDIKILGKRLCEMVKDAISK